MGSIDTQMSSIEDRSLGVSGQWRYSLFLLEKLVNALLVPLAKGLSWAHIHPASTLPGQETREVGRCHCRTGHWQ